MSGQGDHKAMSTDDRLLKIAQAARRWTCSERTIWRYIKAGKLKPIRLPSGAIRIPLSQLTTRPYADKA